MQTSFLKSFDAILSLGACVLAAAWPKSKRLPLEKTLVLRPGGLGDLICADIALQELALDSKDFTWLVEKRSQPWARFRGLPHLCYDEDPLRTLFQVWNRYSLVINTEQLFGLSEAYALLARNKGGRVISFDTNRRAERSDHTVSYDWRNRHETVEFSRLFAAALNLPERTGPRSPRPRLYPPSAPPLVVVAGRQSRSRRLTLNAWTDLISKWHGNRSFLIAAASRDQDFVRQLAKRFPNLATSFQGPFDRWCAQISQSEKILTLDGGAVHVASFFGVATFVVFTSGRNGKWCPLGEGSQVLRRDDLPCQPCAKFGQVPPCPYGYACQKLNDVVPVNP